MKKTIASLFLTLICLVVQAQKIDDIIDKPIDDAIGDLEVLMKEEIDADVRLVGIGDVGGWVLESQELNTKLLAYLVHSRGFRNIIVEQNAWPVKSLNTYLRSSAPLDTTKIDDLLENNISPFLRTFTFRELLIWLKNYNLAHTTDMVSFFGIEVNSIIPTAYFLTEYVYPIDEEAGARMSTAWGVASHSDSQAYQDMEEWLEQMDTEGLSLEHQYLVRLCKQDILYNKTAIKMRSLQNVTPSDMEDYSNYKADAILALVDNDPQSGSIYFGPNAQVARAKIQSNDLPDDILMNTVGKILHDKLKERYYVSAVDCADSIRSIVIDPQTMTGEVVTFSGSSKVKEMILENDAHFQSKDKTILAGFVPTIISVYKNRKGKLVYDKGMASVDAVFLFDNLSEAPPIPDRPQ